MYQLTAYALVITLLPATPLWQAGSQARANTPSSAQNILPSKGTIEQGTYKNPSIGLEFTPTENLHFKEPELKGTPGTTPLVISCLAAADRGLLSGLFSTRSVAGFYADALAYYHEEQRNPDTYLKKIIRERTDGFKQVDGQPTAMISGISFVRADFVKGPVHEAVLVTTHNGYAFVFMFADSDVAATDHLIATTKVKFTR